MVKQKQQNRLLLAGIAAVSGIFLLLLVLNIFFGEHWLDSDMAAEMIFSKLLAEEGRLISTPDWYYSTEFRVLYTQLIMAPLHRICSDWHVIRVITNVVFYVLMFGSFWFVCKPLRLKTHTVLFCSLGLFIPVSEAVMTHLQMGNTYMSHVILCFVTFGLFLRICEGSARKGYLYFYWGTYAVLCVILGVSGVRYLLDLLVPVVLTAFLTTVQDRTFQAFRTKPGKAQLTACMKGKAFRRFFISIGGLFAGLIGYLINALYISRIYQFQTYDSTSFIVIQGGVLMERLQNAAGALLQVMGYIENRSVLSLRGLITMLSFVMLAVLFYVWRRCFRKERLLAEEGKGEAADMHRGFTVCFAGVSMLLHLFVFVFTGSTMVDRYYIPVLIFFLLTVGIYMEWERLVFDRVAVCLILGGCLFLAGAKTCFSFISNDKNASRYEVAEYLAEEGYTFGYASYWNSNIMTELSDGKLEMANLWSLASLGDFKWSSRVESYEPKEGKIFLLASRDELPLLEDKEMLEKQEIIFENEDYVVLHFDSQEAFLAYRE